MLKICTISSQRYVCIVTPEHTDGTSTHPFHHTALHLHLFYLPYPDSRAIFNHGCIIAVYPVRQSLLVVPAPLGHSQHQRALTVTITVLFRNCNQPTSQCLFNGTVSPIMTIVDGTPAVMILRRSPMN